MSRYGRWTARGGLVAAISLLVIAGCGRSERVTGASADSVVANPDFRLVFVGPSPTFGPPGAFLADTAAILAQVSSAYELKSVIVSAAGRQAALTTVTLAYCGTCRAATLDLSGLPVGPIDVSIVATDVRGVTQSVKHAFIHDNPPRINVSEPVDWSVARGSIRVRATCTDDSGACAAIGLDAQDPATSRSKTQVDTLVARPDGFARLRVTATDRFGQTAFVDRAVFFESSARLSELASATIGRIYDVEGATILYATDSLNQLGSAVARTLWLRAGNGQPQPIATAKDFSSAYLTPRGAIYQTATDFGLVNSIGEWRDGALLTLSNGVFASAFAVNGSFVVWTDASSPQLPLFRRDLANGVTMLVGSGANTGQTSLAPNGDVSWSTAAGDLLWLHNSAVQRIAQSTAGLTQTNPVTDGSLVVFRRATPPTNRCPCSIVAIVNGAEVVLSNSDGSYTASGGWIAFTKPGLDSTTRLVWTRSPGGVIRQVDQLNGVAKIEALLDDGTVILSTEPGARRFISSPPYVSLTDIGAEQGTVVVHNGRPIELLGRSALAISW